ncbi:MAG: phosphotransferase, partial [Candidatus Eremiobacteraeota bacterium]|nr:phosphotransferase [Candidatus Eremiobacteraeota bacterium]
GTYALKGYRRSADDPRDRLGAEIAGLAYAASVLPGSVPEIVGADRTAGVAAYEWIEGEPVSEVGAAEIEEALALAAALHRGRTIPLAGSFPAASEAILRPADLRTQLFSRLERLSQVASSEPELEQLLSGRLRPALARFEPALADVRPPTAGERTLSPSDFGFHNALRREGRLVFLDFEYFGWDDPAKLVCDFLWHPGMTLGPGERRQFLAGATDAFKEGISFVSRLHAYEPLIALRWAAIVLGEFLPEVWERRKYAGRAAPADHASAKQRQLAKARAILDRLETETERPRC